VQHFLDKYGQEARKPGLIVTPAAMDRLMVYDWPGNVRELENVIERAVVLCGEREIDVDLIPDHVSQEAPTEIPDVAIPPEGIQFREIIIGYERRYIEAALEASGNVQKKAAELLHIKPTTLNEMIKRYDIRPRRKKAGSEETVESEVD
jgi:DNA-binding NtrC family response regulator